MIVIREAEVSRTEYLTDPYGTESGRGVPIEWYDSRLLQPTSGLVVLTINPRGENINVKIPSLYKNRP